MNWLLRRASILSFVPAFAQIAPAHQIVAQIAGHVMQADNGTPIEGATIDLEIALGDMQARYIGDFSEIAKTDRSGQYTLQGTPPGVYVITVSAPGFISDAYPHESDTSYRTSTQPGTPALVLRNGMEFKDLNFKLTREGVIRGVVVDTDRAAVRAGLPVVALRKGIRPDGSVNYWGAGTIAKTDEEGHFAVRQLPPGAYTLCVNCELTTVAWGVCWFGDIGGPDEYPATWYGDTRQIENAEQISLKDGEVSDSIRIKVRRVNRYSIVVWPSTLDSQEKSAQYEVYLLDWWAEGKLQEDGSYVIKDVPPGRYTMVVRAWPRGRPHETKIEVEGMDLRLNVAVSAK